MSDMKFMPLFTIRTVVARRLLHADAGGRSMKELLIPGCDGLCRDPGMRLGNSYTLVR